MRPTAFDRMRAIVALALVVALAGCSGGAGDECAPLPDQAIVESVSGRDASVRLPDGQPAVLHLSAAVFVREGGTCTMTGPAGVQEGDTITFDVDVWAESYPMQGWPETAVIVR